MKHQIFIKLLTVVLAAGLTAYSGLSQFDTQSETVKIRLYKSQDKAHRKDELKIAVLVEVKQGWHINSQAPNDEFLIPTSLEILPEEDFELTSLQFPDALLLKLSFSEEPVSVYEGHFLIGGVVRIPEDIKFGEHSIPVEFRYQACDDLTCQPPRTISLELLIPVVDDHVPVKEINKDIFAKLKFFPSGPAPEALDF